MQCLDDGEEEEEEEEDEEDEEEEETESKTVSTARPRRMSELNIPNKTKPIPEGSSLFVFSQTNKWVHPDGVNSNISSLYQLMNNAVINWMMPPSLLFFKDELISGDFCPKREFLQCHYIKLWVCLCLVQGTVVQYEFGSLP